MAPGHAGRVEALAKDLDLPLTPIGGMTKGGGLKVIGVDGREMVLRRKGGRMGDALPAH